MVDEEWMGPGWWLGFVHCVPVSALILLVGFVGWLVMATLCNSVLFCSLAFLDPRVGHTMDVLSPFISILCHSD